MWIFRVECEKCGLGPYICACDAEFHRWIQGYSSMSCYLTLHPGMLVDVPHKNQDNWWGLFSQLHSGFDSETQLQSWFEDMIEEIMGRFSMAIYRRVPYVLVGKSKRQVFFLKGGRVPEYSVLRCGTQYL